jgi:hypothetical protein
MIDSLRHFLLVSQTDTTIARVHEPKLVGLTGIGSTTGSFLSGVPTAALCVAAIFAELAELTIPVVKKVRPPRKEKPRQALRLPPVR